MKHVQNELRASFVHELDLQVKTIEQQMEVKKALCLFERIEAEMTAKIRKQYDPEGNSPRRHALRIKAREFELAFQSMKVRVHKCWSIAVKTRPNQWLRRLEGGVASAPAVGISVRG